jgi:3-isopropylmalate/(R)-2-methylmalate dehydratase small subunit
VVLAEQEVAELFRWARETPQYQVRVDLEQLRVSDESGFSAAFTIDDFTRHCLLERLDDIGLTMQHEPEIAAYEARHPVSSSVKHLSPST